MISPALRSSQLCSEQRVRRRSGVPSNAITERERRRVRESGILSLSALLSFVPPLRRTRARSRRTRRGIRGERGHLFPCLSHLAARVHDYDAPVPLIIPLERESSVDSDTRSARAIHPPFLLRGSYAAVGARARARAAPRDHGRYAVDPRAAAAAARNRVNASPVVLLVHLGRRPGRRETAGLSSSPRVVDRFIHDSPRIRGRVSRALVTGERPTIARTRAPGTAARKQSLVT